jgi:hypothetical protein
MRKQNATSRILRFTGISLIVLIVAAACQSAPPTQYLLEVTREVTRVVVVTATPGDGSGPIATEVDAGAGPASTPAPNADATAAEPPPVPTGAAIPTPVSNQIIVSEQAFQNGRMFWLEPNREIWVMIEDGESSTQGTWLIRNDTWDEATELAFDPSITPPDEDLFQPERGFGKLWRENQELRDALGWALDPEYGHATTYTYVFRGEIAGGEFQPEPGYHTLLSRTGVTYLFDEATGMWQQVAGDE